ncbi:armadillo-type protein [Nemania diffusa]|nr:armadillo-type protein [Nemania diffusa]
MFSDRPSQLPRQTGGFKLSQVYPSPESDTITDIDIIAIHGLDTDSTITWTWKHRDSNKQDVNWLIDPDMLPRRIPTARIFTCDWPASLFKDKLTIQMTIRELARSLLLAIQSRPGASPARPILFIASCLGGIILIQAMNLSAEPGSEYNSLWEATRAIVFLATPFRGTAFQEIASKAVDFLKTYASLTDRVVTNLLGNLKESTPFLQDLVSSFTSICVQRKQRDQSYRLAGFYETEMSNPLRKSLPPLVADTLKEPKVLVDSNSARLDIITNPIALQRTHVRMNKFYGPEDPGYRSVSGQIEIIVRKIRQARPIDKANAWILNKKYSLGNLGIERLSGDLLPMDRCYINLAIVEQASHKTEHSTGASPFSLLIRLRIERTDKEKEITLSSLFEPREIRGRERTPSRILIRGRAGVGKTTLCKKIIYEFTHCALWQSLFDCVFWVPLRNLKLEDRRHNSSGYNMKWLFYHEYFTQHPEGEELAGELWRALTDAGASKMLFVLDGLDEVSQDLDGGMLNFLRTLLNQPNVIITSRPNANLPENLKPLDLELETIGFYPDQVDAYIKNAFTDQETGEAKITELQSFLETHQLIQDLVRIPIQLDALCYTWNDDSSDIYYTSKDVQETMTAIYQRIEQRLWRKDAERLEKLKPHAAQRARPPEIIDVMEPELNRLAFLAFTGIINDVINFEPTHRDEISKHFKHPDQKSLLDDVLERVSFLRSSDSSPKKRDRVYHFLHLTFQEYFAARYFAQQWTDQGKLKCLVFGSRKTEDMDPVDFLTRNKYTARYNIFWRFVAGLITTERETTRFFQTIEDEPRDLLGRTHQLLVMHCLSEVSKEISFRKSLEDQLSQWLLFECKFTKTSDLAREIEFPVEILKRNLEQEPIKASPVLQFLTKRRSLYGEVAQSITPCFKAQDWFVRYRAIRALTDQPEIIEEHLQAIAECLRDQKNRVRCAAIEAFKGRRVTGEHLQAIAEHLQNSDEDVRCAAITALQDQQVTKDHLPAIIECLRDESKKVRSAVIEALKGQPVTEKHLQAIAEHLQNSDEDVRCAAIEALQDQPITEEYLQAIRECLRDEIKDVRFAAIKALKCQPVTEKNLQAIAERFKDKEPYVRSAAIEAFPDQPITEEHLQAIVACLKDESSIVIGTTIKTLQSQSVMEEHLHAIIAFLKDKDYSLRQTALEALGTQPLTEKHLQAVAACLQDREDKVRFVARQILENQLKLPDRPLALLMGLLEHKSKTIRDIAVRILKARPITKDYLQVIGARLENKDWSVRTAAIETLKGRLALPGTLLQAIAARLKDDNCIVIEAAIEALQGQPALSDELLQAITAAEIAEGWPTQLERLLRSNMAYLENEYMDVRLEALKGFQDQPALLEGALQAVVARLEDKSWNVREAALKVLQNQPKLPEGILQAVVARLGGRGEEVRGAAIQVLLKQPELSDGLLRAAAAHLESRRWYIRISAIEVFQDQRKLPEDILQTIAAHLTDKVEMVRDLAMETLGQQPVLSEDLLQAVANRLKHEDPYAKLEAMRALRMQPALSGGILRDVTAGLEDDLGYVREAAIQVLKNQPALSEGHLQAIVARLKDDARDVREEAMETLLSRHHLSSIPNQHVKDVYEYLLRRSFQEHITWQVVGETSYITLSNEEYSMNLPSPFMSAVSEAQKTIGVPPRLDILLCSTSREVPYHLKRRLSV